MPKGSIDYKIMQKTSHACSILLPCSWEDMGTLRRWPVRWARNAVTISSWARPWFREKRTSYWPIRANVSSSASDHLVVVVTESTVFVGDRNTDMKTLLEYVAEQAPEIV